jgi:spore coat polysaccharide biosynthesis protein SpsF (cytidylyltransferase family)
MNEYSFEVGVRAVVRVQGSNPDVARKVVESVLGAPGSQEIELANQKNLVIGRNATVTAVNFVQKTRPKLVPKRLDQRRSAS